MVITVDFESTDLGSNPSESLLYLYEINLNINWFKLINMNEFKPIYISELEYNYENLINLIKLEKTFIVNGEESIGKLTVIKLYLEYLNYDYNIINSDILFDDFINNYQFKSKSVFSYLYDKKYTLIIKNFQNFDFKIREFILKNKMNNFYILIKNTTFIKNIQTIYIKPPSFDYLSFIYLNLYFLETGKYDIKLPDLKNFHDIYNYLYLNLKSENNIIKFEKDIYKKSEINQIINLENFQDKLNAISKLESHLIINNNLIFNYNIEELSNSYDYLIESFKYYKFYNINHYEIFNSLNIIGSLYYFNKDNIFNVQSSYFEHKNKIKFNYI